MDELKPCPFCNKPPITTPSGEGGNGLMIECLTEGCVNPHVSYYNHDVARTAWNTRPREDAGVVDQWRPIETAPMDGSDVIVFEPYSDPVVAFYSQMNRKWLGPRDSYGDAEVMQPTHWRPLPQPPALAAALGESNG